MPHKSRPPEYECSDDDLADVGFASDKRLKIAVGDLKQTSSWLRAAGEKHLSLGKEILLATELAKLVGEQLSSALSHTMSKNFDLSLKNEIEVDIALAPFEEQSLARVDHLVTIGRQSPDHFMREDGKSLRFPQPWVGRIGRRYGHDTLPIGLAMLD
jgi:hypothetical protein